MTLPAQTVPILPLTGACRCGRVRLTVTAPPLLTAICHCTGCQRMTGGAFSTTLAVPTGALSVEGETVLGGLRGAQARHHHCDWCKSWVFTRIEPDMGFVNVRATMLDDSGWFVPFVETYTREALPWAIAGAPRTYPAFPEMDEYPVLLDDYRVWAPG